MVLRRDRAAPLRLGLRADPRRRRRLRPRPRDGRRDDLRRPRGAPAAARRPRCGSRWRRRGARTACCTAAAKALNVAVGLGRAAALADRAAAAGSRFARCWRASIPSREPLPMPPAARAVDGRPDGRPRGDPAAAFGLEAARCCARECRPVHLRPRPAARGRQHRLRLSGASSPTTSSRAPTASTSPRAIAAARRRARPGLIVVHGLFSSRRFDYVREIAVRAFFEWGFNVAAIDLRSFGLTEPDQPGADEHRLEGGRGHPRLRALPEATRARPRSGRSGSRSAARSVLGACHPEGADEALDGGILAISPPRRPARGGRAALAQGPALAPGIPHQPGLLGDADVADQAVGVGGRRGLRRPDRADLGALLRGRAG